MANITLTSADLLIPEVWANEGIRALRRKIRLARLVTRDSDYGTFNEGDKLNIALPPSFVVNTKTAGGAVTLQQPTDSVISVTLNQHKEVSFLLEDAVKAMRGGPGSGQTGIERYMNAAIEPIVLAIEDALFALYSGFSTTVGTSGTDLSAASLRTVAKNFNDAGIPEENRNIVIATKDYAALQADTSLAAFFANATPEAIKSGQLTNIAGLNIAWSNRVPVVAGSPNSTKNIALAPDAMILAMRNLPTDGNTMGARQTVMVDQESGLSIRVTMAYNPTYLGTQVTLEFSRRLQADGEAAALAWLAEQRKAAEKSAAVAPLPADRHGVPLAGAQAITRSRSRRLRGPPG